MTSTIIESVLGTARPSHQQYKPAYRQEFGAQHRRGQREPEQTGKGM